MVIKSYFFNAVQTGDTYDQTYSAEDVTSYLDKIVGNGVFPNPSTNLQVAASSGMSVIVRAGQGWIDGHKMVNTADMPLTVEPADVVLNRIDAVIFYVDHTSREMGIAIKAGTPANSPSAPVLTRNTARYELCLARIRVNKQTAAITASMITDTRGNSGLCGFVQGLIQQADTTTLFDQWQSGYDEWFTDTQIKGTSAIDKFKGDLESWFNEIKEDLLKATIIRKYEANYTTTSANEDTFNVKFLIPQYSWALDILEIRINGLTLSSNEYSKNENEITIAVPIEKPGTSINFVIYKSVNDPGVTAAMQSDWNETDETQISFIKNKPTKVSKFENDAGYLTEETDPTVPAWAKAASKPTYNYYEIEDTPTIPAAFTDLTGILPITQGGTGAATASMALTNLGAVPQTRTINSKPLNSDIELNCNDVGASSEDHKHDADEITSGMLPIERGGTGASTQGEALTNLGTISVYTTASSFISYPCTMSELIQAMLSPAVLMVGVDSASNSITDLPCSYGILTIHKRAGSRIQVLYNRSYEGTANGNYLFFGIYNTNSKSLTWNKIFTNHTGCQIPIENGGTGATTYKDAQKNFHFYTDLAQLGITVPCTTADVVDALPTSSIFLLGTESVSASISDAPTGYGFFSIFKGANPNRKFELFARSLTNTENYETGNWFYIMNVANGAYSWQKVLTNVSTDNSLLTNNKTIVGAINEIYTKLKSSEMGTI